MMGANPRRRRYGAHLLEIDCCCHSVRGGGAFTITRLRSRSTLWRGVSKRFREGMREYDWTKFVDISISQTSGEHVLQPSSVYHSPSCQDFLRHPGRRQAALREGRCQ